MTVEGAEGEEEADWLTVEGAASCCCDEPPRSMR